MQSNTTTTRPSIRMEHIHSSDVGRHIWNIYSKESSQTIDEYYLRQQMSLLSQPTMKLDKALSYHHALVSRSFVSSAKLLVREFPKGLCVNTGHGHSDYFDTTNGRIDADNNVDKHTNTARITRHLHHHCHCLHRNCNTYQLITLSAMSGLLIARLFTTSPESVIRRSLRSMKQHAQITAYYIHSALASEILIGNRYYRNIRNITPLKQAVGTPNINYQTEDISPANISTTKRQLCQLYASEIGRLTDLVKQYKRGLVNLDEIQNDPEFGRLFTVFWRYSNQVMKKKTEFEKHVFSLDSDDDDDDDDDDPSARNNKYNRRRRFDRFNAIKQIKQFFVFSEIFDVFVLVPRLYDYDIVHLFDNKNQSFVKYVKGARNTLIRLANDGITAAFLSFAAIEPTMVTPEMAPRVGEIYQNISLKSCANHIPRRDPLYGALRVKHSAHIPRTASVVVIYPRRGRSDNNLTDDGIVKSVAGSEESQTRNRIQRTIQHIRKSSIRKLYLEVNKLEW